MGDDIDRSAELIERMLGDPQLRASFRADPGAVLRDNGLTELADGLPAGRRALLTLELRESRSSLAGVIVAAAAEGVDFTHVAEQAAPRLGSHAGHALSSLAKKVGHHKHAAPHHATPARAAKPAPAKPDLGPSAALPQLARPPHMAHHHDATVPPPPSQPPATSEPPPSATDPTTTGPTGSGHDHVGDGLPDPASTHDVLQYPGDNATPAQIAAWMGATAKRAGLPPELPVIAALTESGLRNLDYGDRDSVGFFQMRVGIWNTGAYSGYPSNPQLQLKWFIDHAINARAANPTLGDSPSSYGQWAADVEQPAAQFRYRYQLQLERAQELLRHAHVSDSGGARSIVDHAAPTGGSHAHHADHRVGRGVSGTATACVGAKCRAGGAEPGTGFDGAGLVRYAYAREGVKLPGNLQALFEVGGSVSRQHLRPGDAVFYGTASSQLREVGLYVGDGKVVIARSGGERVSMDALQHGSLFYLGARRYTDKLLAGAINHARTLPTIKR